MIEKTGVIEGLDLPGKAEHIRERLRGDHRKNSVNIWHHFFEQHITRTVPATCFSFLAELGSMKFVIIKNSENDLHRDL